MIVKLIHFNNYFRLFNKIVKIYKSMIHKSRKFLAHLLAPVSRNLRFSFTQTTQSTEYLQILEGKALLSYKIIEEIKKPQFNIEQKSLRQHLVDMIESTTEVPSSSRELMKSMFTTGIQIEQNVFNQQRIKNASFINPQNKTIFIFCPTRLVTTQMFNSIKNKANTNTLFMGHYGISKSISVMLYTILSNYIAEYKFKTYGQTPTPLGAQIDYSPKVIYYNLQSMNNIKDITNSIIKQCSTQIGINNKYTFLNFFKKTKKNEILLRKYYQEKGLNIILFLDQISKVVGAQKRLSVQKTRKKKISESIENFKLALEFLSPEFNLIHYLSSVDIQFDRILKSFKLGGQRGHEILGIAQIDYLQKLLIKDAAYQIVDCFLFQILRNFKIPLLSNDLRLTPQQVPQQFKKYISANSSTINLNSIIRNYLSSKLISSEGYLLTFYSIRNALNNKKPVEKQFFQTFDSVQKIDGLIKRLQNQLNLLVIASHAQVQQKLQLFFNKQQEFSKLTDQKKYIIIFQLYKSASAFKGSADQQNLYTIAVQSDFQRTTIAEIVPHISKNLFKLDRHGLKSYIPPKLLMSILQPYMEQTFVYFLKNDINKMKTDYNTQSLSNLTQTIFARMVFQSRPTIKLLFHSKKEEDIQQFKIEASKKYSIKPIQQTNSKNMYQWPLVKDVNQIIIKQLQKNTSKRPLQKDFFFTTNQKFRLYTSEQLQDIKTSQAIRNNDNKGLAIDFFILSLVFVPGQNPQVKFTAFDITIGKQIFNKIFKFVKVFDNFKNKNNLMMEFGLHKVQMSLDFFVLGPPPQWKTQPQTFKKYMGQMKSNLVFDKDIDENATVCKVKSFQTNESPSLLKHVGYVTIGKTLAIESETEKDVKDPNAGIKIWRLIEAILQNKV